MVVEPDQRCLVWQQSWPLSAPGDDPLQGGRGGAADHSRCGHRNFGGHRSLRQSLEQLGAEQARRDRFRASPGIGRAHLICSQGRPFIYSFGRSRVCCSSVSVWRRRAQKIISALHFTVPAMIRCGSGLLLAPGYILEYQRAGHGGIIKRLHLR